MRLPYPLVWNRDSYNKIEPEVREKDKKREWIEWLLKNIVEGKREKWTYEQWVLNAVDNEDYYLDFAEKDGGNIDSVSGDCNYGSNSY